MEYTNYKLFLNPETLNTEITLLTEDGDEDDVLVLTPELADSLSGALILSNANRKKFRVTTKAEGFVGRFHRK